MSYMFLTMSPSNVFGFFFSVAAFLAVLQETAEQAQQISHQTFPVSQRCALGRSRHTMCQRCDSAGWVRIVESTQHPSRTPPLLGGGAEESQCALSSWWCCAACYLVPYNLASDGAMILLT